MKKNEIKRLCIRRMIKLILLMNIKAIEIQWLVPESNEKEMEPVMIELQEKGEFKKFEPSLSETFAYVLKGAIIVRLGKKNYFAKKGSPFTFIHQKNTKSSMIVKDHLKYCSLQQSLIYKCYFSSYCNFIHKEWIMNEI